MREGKFKAPKSYSPSHTVLMTNFLPRIDFFDFGTVRFIILLPFNAIFTGNMDRTSYSEYLVQNVGGAILSWIIEGARKVLLDNFRAFNGDASNPFAVAPKAVQALVDNYDYSSANSGNIAAFISDYCEIGDDYEDIYSKYRIHCSQLATPKIAQGAFNKDNEVHIAPSHLVLHSQLR